MKNGLVVVAPFGCGKDYFLDRVQDALIARGAPFDYWQVGDYFYDYLSREIGVPVDEIRKEKPLYRSRLQDIGSTLEIQQQAEAASYERWMRAAGTRLLVARRLKEFPRVRESATVIYLDADEQTRADRIERRDGVRPTREQFEHPAEPRREDIAADFELWNGSGGGEIFVACREDSLVIANALGETHVRLDTLSSPKIRL